MTQRANLQVHILDRAQAEHAICKDGSRDLVELIRTMLASDQPFLPSTTLCRNSFKREKASINSYKTMQIGKVQLVQSPND